MFIHKRTHAHTHTAQAGYSLAILKWSKDPWEAPAGHTIYISECVRVFSALISVCVCVCVCVCVWWALVWLFSWTGAPVRGFYSCLDVVNGECLRQRDTVCVCVCVCVCVLARVASVYTQLCSPVSVWGLRRCVTFNDFDNESVHVRPVGIFFESIFQYNTHNPPQQRQEV